VCLLLLNNEASCVFRLTRRREAFVFVDILYGLTVLCKLLDRKSHTIMSVFKKSLF